MSSGLASNADEASAELKRRIVIFLSQKGVTSVRLLNIEVANDTVTFRGTVPNFYERQLCLSCQHIPGVRKVVDDLKVEIPSLAVEREPSASAENSRKLTESDDRQFVR